MSKDANAYAIMALSGWFAVDGWATGPIEAAILFVVGFFSAIPVIVFVNSVVRAVREP